MSKPLVIVLPHELGVEEARRRIDSRADWAMRKLADNKIQATAEPWDGNERGFTAVALGQKIAGIVRVAADDARFEVGLPLPLRPFAPVIEAVAKKYAGPLFAPAKT